MGRPDCSASSVSGRVPIPGYPAERPGVKAIQSLLKNADRPTYTGGWSISADGKDVRFFYMTPSHHAWLDDSTILEGRHFTIHNDDGRGKPHRVAGVGNVDFDPTVLPGGQWFLLDTYPIEGYQYVVLFHRPSRLFVPLAKLKNTAQVMTDYPGVHGLVQQATQPSGRPRYRSALGSRLASSGVTASVCSPRGSRPALTAAAR